MPKTTTTTKPPRPTTTTTTTPTTTTTQMPYQHLQQYVAVSICRCFGFLILFLTPFSFVAVEFLRRYEKSKNGTKSPWYEKSGFHIDTLSSIIELTYIFILNWTNRTINAAVIREKHCVDVATEKGIGLLSAFSLHIVTASFSVIFTVLFTK